MTDLEYDILDELYFLLSFESIINKLNLKEDTCKNALEGLHEKDWIKCYESAIMEPFLEVPDFESNYKKYYYLATKAGLLAHNSK